MLRAYGKIFTFIYHITMCIHFDEQPLEHYCLQSQQPKSTKVKGGLQRYYLMVKWMMKNNQK